MNSARSSLKKRKMIAMDNLRRSKRLSEIRDRPVKSHAPKSRPVKSHAPKSRRGYTSKIVKRKRSNHGTFSKPEILKSAEQALSGFNEKSLSEQGLEYEVVKPLRCYARLLPIVYHCNFIARPKNGTAATNKLFFAEFRYLRIGDEPLAHCCTVCCILGSPHTKTGRQDCNFCPCEHPADVEFTKDYILPK